MCRYIKLIREYGEAQMRISIAQKLNIIFCFFIIILTSAILFLSYPMFASQIFEKIKGQSTNNVTHTMQPIDHILFERVGDIELLTSGKNVDLVKGEEGEQAQVDYHRGSWLDIEANELLRIFFLMGLFLVVMLIALNVFFSRAISKPLIALTMAMKETGKGNFDKVVDVKTNDEIGQLSQAFNIMVNHLKNVTASRDELDKEIQKRERTEQALRTNEERTRAIIETVNDAFVSMDEEGAIIDWNRGAESIFGWPRLEIMGKSMIETIIPPQYHEAYTKGLKHFVKTGECPVFEKMLELSALHHDGREFPIETMIWFIRVNDTYQFNAFIRDISVRKTAEKNLRGILEGAPNAMVIANNEGKIVLVNTQTEKLFGYERKDLIGKPFENLMPKRFQNTHIDYKRGCFMDSDVRPMGSGREFYGMKKDGREFPVEISLSPLDTEEGVLVISAINDITERKKMEDEIKKTNQELLEQEKDSRKTFAELQKAHDDLKQAQSQLFQSEKLASIGQLAAGVAHEINNPVGFISNNMEILQEYIQDYTKILRIIDNLKRQIVDGDIEKARSTIAELKKFEEEINLDYIMNDVNTLLEHSGRGLERIKKIVMDLRMFAREENVETMEFVQIEEVIDSILSIVQNEIKYKAELTKDYGDTGLVKCNAQRLGQVFINLLVNASQAIEERGRITIKTYQQDKYLCIDVTDTGHGIAPENLKKIFDPFFTTKPVGKGTGLGLSVSYEIVKKHGGEIKVQSKAGEGTTFTVMLPIT